MPKKRKKPKAKLTAEWERFVDEYVVSLNATTAYQRAYPGCSYASARSSGSDLLAKPSIKAAVKEQQKALAKRNHCEADKVIRELMRLAFSDIEDVMDLTDQDRPRLRHRDEINPEARRAIQEIAKTEHGVKVKLSDKQGALDKLMRHLGLYQDLPALEVLLAALPPDVAASVRAALAAQVHGSGDRGHGSTPGHTGTGSTTSGPDAGDAGGGTDPGPVARETGAVPGPASGGPLHTALGQDEDGGGEGDGPLLDAPE